VKRELLKSKAFIRSAKKFIKKSPQIIDDLKETLELLSEDAFYPSLKTHKLKGNLEGSWACSAGYDLRIASVGWVEVRNPPFIEKGGFRYRSTHPTILQF